MSAREVLLREIESTPLVRHYAKRGYCFPAYRMGYWEPDRMGFIVPPSLGDLARATVAAQAAGYCPRSREAAPQEILARTIHAGSLHRVYLPHHRGSIYPQYDRHLNGVLSTPVRYNGTYCLQHTRLRTFPDETLRNLLASLRVSWQAIIADRQAARREKQRRDAHGELADTLDGLSAAQLRALLPIVRAALRASASGGA